MVHWRRYTGAKRLQLAWSVLAVLATVATAQVPAVTALAGGPAPVYVAGGAVWLVGLFVVALRKRLNWRRLVRASSFEEEFGVATADLQTIRKGHSIAVDTYMPSLFAQSHTRISTRVDGVEAEFTITAEFVGEGGAGRGLATGNEGLDEQFVIEGKPGNVEKLLTMEVQSALLDVGTPGTLRATNEEVVYEIPFTDLSADELRTCSEAVVAVVTRLEAVGRG